MQEQQGLLQHTLSILKIINTKGEISVKQYEIKKNIEQYFITSYFTFLTGFKTGSPMN